MSGFSGMHQHSTPPHVGPTQNSTENGPNTHPTFLNNQQLSEGQYDSSTSAGDSTILSEKTNPRKHPYFRSTLRINSNNPSHHPGDHLSSHHHSNDKNNNNDNSSHNYNSESKKKRRRSTRAAAQQAEGPQDWFTHSTGRAGRGGGDGAASYQMSEYSEVNENVFIVCTYIILTMTAIIIVFMLLPLRFCHRNPHIPVLLWSVSILLPIALRSDQSMPLRVGLGWVLVETFLIWVTLPLRLRLASFYSITLAVAHTALVLKRGYQQPHMARQVKFNFFHHLFP